MVQVKRVLCIVAAALGIMSLTACWDHVEINKMLIISGIGLDVDSTGSIYHATIEFVNVETDGGENIAAEIVEGKGDTVQNAIQKAMLAAGGTLFGNHCKVIVIGEDFARKGLGGVVEMVLRSPDFRKTVNILIAKDSTAADVFTKDTVVNDIISYELAKMLANNETKLKNTASTNAYELHETLSTSCSFSVLPSIDTRQRGDESILLVDGCAVLTGDQLQGFIDGEQSKLFQMITRNKQNITITIKDDSGNGKPIDVNITDSKVKLIPHINDDVLSMRITVDAKATLENTILLGTDPMNIDTRKQMQSSISEQLSGNIMRLIDESQEQYGADIFRFYLEYQDLYRMQWDTLRQDWESYFRDIDIQVTSDVKITGSGLIGKDSTEGDDAVALP